ncbi:hypothetical protein ACVIIV_003241 [Bradyrhizobium sp. USDA 4354]
MLIGLDHRPLDKSGWSLRSETTAQMFEDYKKEVFLATTDSQSVRRAVLVP